MHKSQTMLMLGIYLNLIDGSYFKHQTSSCELGG